MTGETNRNIPSPPAGAPVRLPSCLIPSPPVLANLLAGLVGSHVSVKSGAPVSIGPKAPVAVAIYTRDDKSVAAVCIYDLALANATGAALATIPSNVADENTRAGKVGDVILENFKEVLDIIATVFRTSDSQHIGLASTHLVPPEKIPGTAAAAIMKPVARADFSITFPGYSPGKVTIVVR